MRQKQSLIELVNSICLRADMYTDTGSYSEVVAYITGYAHGLDDSPISGENWKVFSQFVCLKFSFPTNCVWWYPIRQSAKNEKEAIESISKIIAEFVYFQKEMSNAELLAYAKASAKSTEGEAERLFRKFDKALLEGREDGPFHLPKSHLV